LRWLKNALIAELKLNVVGVAAMATLEEFLASVVVIVFTAMPQAIAPTTSKICLGHLFRSK